MSPAESPGPIIERWIDFPPALVNSIAKSLGWTPAMVRMALRRLDAKQAMREAERYDRLAEKLLTRRSRVS
jgi:hypothetical protein